MSTSVVHEGTLLMHEGGTKFYETMVFHAADHGQHLLVKRWGKTSAMSGGGEIQILSHPNARKAQAAADNVIRQKEGRGYAKRGVAIGLHGYGGTIDSSNLAQLLKTHYGTDNAQAILREFMDELRGTQITGVWVDEADSIVSEEPAPEPERGETWGSW